MKKCLITATLILAIAAGVYAGNTDPYDDGSKYAYGENVGWFDFNPSQGPGVTIYNGKVTGFVWQENAGWINLSPADYGGVTYDSNRHLSGYAWGENIGWIHFSSAEPVDYGVRACVVGIDDLANFAGQWLMDGSGLAADLNKNTHVDFTDHSIFAQDWLSFCPDGWLLK